MTVIDTVTPSTYELVAVDTYRDIHKGIRADLFALTRRRPAASTRRAPPTSPPWRRHLDPTVDFLVVHAGHEDTHLVPVMSELLPDLNATIERDHATLEGRGSRTCRAGPGPRSRRRRVRPAARCSASTSSWRRSPRRTSPTRTSRSGSWPPSCTGCIGAEGVLAIHQAILASIPPDQMAASLALMLPAMNNDDRTEMLGGMQAGAPPEVFAGVWSLAGSVLEPRDVAVLARRLGV